MADDPPAGQHPVRGHDHVRPRGARDRLRGLDVVGDDLVRVVERRVARAQERSPSPRRSSPDGGGRRRTPSRPSANRGTAAGAGSRRARSADRAPRRPPGCGRSRTTGRAARRRRRRPSGPSRPASGWPRPRGRARGRRRSIRRGRSPRRPSASGRAGSACRAGRGRPRRRSTRSGPPSCSVTRTPDDRRAEDVAGVDERGMDARRDLDLLAVAERLELDERRASASLAVYSGASRSMSSCGGWARSSASGSRGQVDGAVAPGPRPRRRRDRGRRGSARCGAALDASAPAVALAGARPARAPPRTRRPGVRSSAATLSGWCFSQRASRFANSSWSLPESSRTSVASSIVPAVAWIRSAVARP